MQKFGIDVSLWQAGFDFARAKKEGVEFVILKQGQANYIDPQFENHYKAAKAQGLHLGAYHYLVAENVNDAKLEAMATVRDIKGKTFDYPIFCDVEAASQRRVGKKKLTEVVSAYCSVLEENGYWAGIYTYWDFYKNALDSAALKGKYSLWLAAYMSKCPMDCSIWQFGGETNLIRSNKVAGVVCDQNYCYRDFPSEIKKAGLNGFEKDTTTIRAGVGVKILEGAKYPNGKLVPLEIRRKWWYVKYITNDGKACLDWSVDGTKRLFAEIPINKLQRYPE